MGTGDHKVERTADADLDIRDLSSTQDSVECIQDTAADLNMTEASASAIKDSVEIMDDWDETNRAKVNVNLNSGVAVDIGAGNASTGTARVSVATDDVNLSAIKTAVEIMDDWDETNRAKTNIIVGQAGIAAGSGADGVTVPRVSLATNVALPSGSNTIGDVSVTTVKPDGTNTMPSGDVTARPIYTKLTDGTTDSDITTQNELKTLPSNLGVEIAKGNVSGMSFIHKFGGAPDFDTGDNEVTQWDGADDGNINQMIYQYSSSADIDSLSSSDDTDTQAIEVQGLDTNFDLVTQTITLTGQTRVALTTDLVRVFRLKNTGTTNNAGHVYCFVNVATTAGVPNTAANVRAVIQPGNNQTLMSVYTIPNAKKGYLCSFFAGTAGAKKSAAYIIRVKVRPTGEVFQLKHLTSLVDDGTSHFQHRYDIPEVLQAKSDIEITVQIPTAAITAASVSGGFDLILVDD